MLEGYVGAEAWRDGVRSYMKAARLRQHRVRRPVARRSRRPRASRSLDIAHDFTLQPGVPLIRVEQAELRERRDHAAPDAGRVHQGSPGQDAAGLARAGDRARCVGSRSRARTLVERRQRHARRAGLRPGDRQRRPERLLPHAVHAGAVRAASRDASRSCAAIDQLGMLTDALGARPGRPAAGLGLPRPGCRRTPVDADPQVWGEIAGCFGSLDAYYARRRGAAGDVPRVRHRAAGAGVRARRLDRTRGRSRAGRPSCARELIGTLGALGDADVVAEARRRYAAQATDPTAMPARAAQDHPRRGRAARRCRDVGTAARRCAAEKTPLVKDELYCAAGDRARTRRWRSARWSWR